MNPASRRWLTPANGLTLLRLGSAPFFYASIMSQRWGLACLIFWLAVASDLMDGRVARSRGESSALGGLFDHATDAIFVVLGQVALARVGLLPTALPILVVAAFLQYGADSRILAGHELRSSSIGRWNGILYFVPPGILVTREALGLALPGDEFILIAGWGLVALTMLSMGDRLAGVILVARGNRLGIHPKVH